MSQTWGALAPLTAAPFLKGLHAALWNASLQQLWVELSFLCRQLQQQNMPPEDFSSGLSGLQNVLDLRALVSDWQCSVCNISWVAHIKLFTSTTIQ